MDADASRFLAQSQSRIVPRPDERPRKDRNRITQQPENSRYLSSRSFLHRRPADPYHSGASQFSNFAFGSRNLAQQAPLFHSATEDFHEEDEEAEHEREIADFYALQRSRRHFGSSHLKDSETDEDGSNSLEASPKQPLDGPGEWPGIGVETTWRTARPGRARGRFDLTVVEKADGEENFLHDSENRTKSNLVDIRLQDTLKSSFRLEDGDQRRPEDDKPPSVQRFREVPRMDRLGINTLSTPHEESEQSLLEDTQQSLIEPSQQTSAPLGRTESPGHDVFWGHLFLISLACLFATSFLVYLHTSPPSRDKAKLGDTIYLTLHGSFYRLGIYTLVSIFISLLWLALLRSYVRPLVYMIIFVVPVILYSFFLYPFISSFRSGSSAQDKIMRFGSFVPFAMATAWVYNVIRSRHSIGKAISILEFACRILATNAELLLLGLGNLVLIVSWTWVWMLMFTRVFLGGHMSTPNSFIVNVSSWWLGAFFVLVYLWSLGVIAGIQRAVTAATVSQWYFHRFTNPTPTSRQVVQAATIHSLTALFGTICLSRLISLLIRIPFLVLPRRIASILSLFTYAFVPAPITGLTSPLALTYAAIHSQPLALSARGLTQMTNLAPSVATTSLHPRSFSRSGENQSHLLPYKLSKLILHAVRLMMSLALGFGGWVSTARSLRVPTDHGVLRGSIYAYIVGLIAGAIGWSVLGAIEGVVADIVDASIICWSSEVGAYGREARYCREAGWLFGQEPNPESRYPA
ncbi:uncharacterized protein DSM5745_08940 [Aspergillus mulundensis]|uniref:Protein PNS1 n=1 Tax=Aspergillus mulundensis TaxID=1810919 RepID=A0A3D8R5E6_9EURO|nr:Uncharacterized protein DSM5745_08940 [Aspergillus mulundensis]RDW69180.1 Uncharacterized protein DSM5745_08940 [Aspergillus mulundensis]